MADHNLFYYPYASFTNAQLPLLKVAALWFDRLVILDPVGASWDTVGADHPARDAVRQLKDAGIVEIVTPATVLAKYERPIADAIRRDMADREFLDLCETHRRPGAGLGQRHSWRKMAARLAGWQEELSGEWAALFVENMNIMGNRTARKGGAQ